MLKSSLCDYSDAYVLVSGNITVVRAVADDAAIVVDGNNKQAIFKNYAPFNDCITETNNTQLHNAKDLDVVMPMKKMYLVLQKGMLSMFLVAYASVFSGVSLKRYSNLLLL